MENIESNGKKTVSEFISSVLPPYRVAGIVLFILFIGADISLFLFGRDATGNTALAIIITLISGVGALIWKSQRDRSESNDSQRSIAGWMILTHSLAATIFLVGNFARGGWDALADKVKLDGVLASDIMNYQMVSEKIFIWTIAIMLVLDIISLFFFQESDTGKMQERVLAKIQRDNRDAEIAAEKSEQEIAARLYIENSQKFAKLKALRSTRDKFIRENSTALSREEIDLMLAPIDMEIAKTVGAIPVSGTDANSSEAAPFRSPSSQRA